MGRNNTLGTLVLGLAAGMMSGCAMIKTPFGGANEYAAPVGDVEDKTEQLAGTLVNRTEHEGVSYEVGKFRHGGTVYHAFMVIDDRAYLVGAIDNDNDREADTFFVYAKEFKNREEALKGLESLSEVVKEDKYDTRLEQHMVKLEGEDMYTLIDADADGSCLDGKRISVKVIDIKAGMGSQVQGLYNSVINMLHSFYGLDKAPKKD